MQITTIGLDIAKNVFQVHGIDTAEKVVVRKHLVRSRISIVRVNARFSPLENLELHALPRMLGDPRGSRSRQ